MGKALRSALFLLNFLNGDLNFAIVSAILMLRKDLLDNKLAICFNGKDFGNILLEMFKMIVASKNWFSHHSNTGVFFLIKVGDQASDNSEEDKKRVM
ncbi:MAG: hypothetical protein ACRC0X_03650 [Brevinema sp.]